jgi:phage regulator Rha-like protein
VCWGRRPGFLSRIICAADYFKIVASVQLEIIERKIYIIRGCKVMLDSDLAESYQVPTKALNQAVRRNRDRFSADLMFRLNAEELGNLRSQIVTSSSEHGGRRSPPYAFTEHGVAMLSSVLSSKRAVALNILIIRAFIRLREYLASHKDLARKLEDIERIQHEHGAHIEQIYGYIQQLLEPPESSKRRIGFRTGQE